MEDENKANDTNDAVSRVESMLAAIKPYQDLAKNWDIDIASCLEEYLNDLVDVMVIDGEQELSLGESNSVSAVPGPMKMNFAKAALVLHNSSHVYGRKVEYLHNLVLSALENMSKTAFQNHEKKRKDRRGNNDEEVEEFWDFDPHQDFLLLDDALPLDRTADCRHINLAESVQEAELTRRLTIGRDSQTMQTPSRPASRTATTINSRTINGSSLRGSAPINPSALLGEPAATSGVLRLMNGVCSLDETGRLILPGSETSKMSCVAEPPLDKREAFSATRASDTNHNSLMDEGPHDHYDPADDDDGGGAVFYDEADDDDNSPSGPSNTPVVDRQASEATAHSVTRQVRFAPHKPDPWALHDPHQPKLSSFASKPLRLGKSVRLPACLDGGEMEEEIQHASRSIAVEAFRCLMEPENNDAPRIPWTGLIYGDEFSDMARRAQAKRSADKRRQRREEIMQRNYQVKDTQVSVCLEDDGNDDEDDGFMGGNDDWGGDDDDDDHDDVRGDMPHHERGAIETNTGITSVDQIYRSNADDTDETDSLADARAFEELCRAHIEAFARGAEKYAAATNLTKRVDHWQKRLASILADEEQRPAFDIFAYSQGVLNRISEVTNGNKAESDAKVPFARVVEGQSTYNICRLFLATLSLANSGNLRIHGNNDDNAGERKEVHVELLSTELERPMEAYLAPSVVNKG